MYVTNQTQATIDERLTSNPEESDTRRWLHVLHLAGIKKLVLIPDTDVYHIGLTVIAETDLDVMVHMYWPTYSVVFAPFQVHNVIHKHSIISLIG